LDLFGHDDARQHNETIYNTQYVPEQHQSSWTHEAIAGAAGFEAMKAYENHIRATGQEPSHPVMKELLAGFAAAEIDKLAETKGLDYIDREKAKRQAIEQAHHLANERYGHGSN
ncbi:putative CipC-like antibiotic response protein, partial [Daedalea quercina L-15889]